MKCAWQFQYKKAFYWYDFYRSYVRLIKSKGKDKVFILATIDKSSGDRSYIADSLDVFLISEEYSDDLEDWIRDYGTRGDKPIRFRKQRYSVEEFKALGLLES